MKFELIAPFGRYKVGQLFEPFGGLVSGISDEDGNRINFDDKEYFRVFRQPNANLLALAISISASAFEEKLDSGGYPYILHPLRVMENPKCNTETRKILAVLHDTVEDTPITLDQLHSYGFPMSILSKLNILTKKEFQSYDDYIKLIASDPDCTAVKLADLEDNSLITRIKGFRKKDFDRLEKYYRAYTYLSGI